MDTHMALSHRSNGKLRIQPKAPLKRSKSGAALRQFHGSNSAPICGGQEIPVAGALNPLALA